MSQSPYAYCDGDPVNNSDPSGHLSAVNIASGGIPISGVSGGAADAPVDTSGDNTSSGSTSGTGQGGSGSGGDGSTGSSGLPAPIKISLPNGNSATVGPPVNGITPVTVGNPTVGYKFGLGADNNITSVGEYLNPSLGGGFRLNLGVSAAPGTGKISGTAGLSYVLDF